MTQIPWQRYHNGCVTGLREVAERDRETEREREREQRKEGSAVKELFSLCLHSYACDIVKQSQAIVIIDSCEKFESL